MRLGGRIQKSLELVGPGFTSDMVEPQDLILFFVLHLTVFFLHRCNSIDNILRQKMSKILQKRNFEKNCVFTLLLYY